MREVIFVANKRGFYQILTNTVDKFPLELYFLEEVPCSFYFIPQKSDFYANPHLILINIFAESYNFPSWKIRKSSALFSMRKEEKEGGAVLIRILFVRSCANNISVMKLLSLEWFLYHLLLFSHNASKNSKQQQHSIPTTYIRPLQVYSACGSRKACFYVC